MKTRKAEELNALALAKLAEAKKIKDGTHEYVSLGDIFNTQVLRKKK